jgi:TonB family protein
MSELRLPPAVGFCALMMFACGASIAVVAQQPIPAEREMLKTWRMKLDVDKLTDQQVLTATATVLESPNSPHVYQLTLRCAGTDTQMNLSTWDTRDAPVGMMNPRPMLWQTQVRQTGGPKFSPGGINQSTPIVQREVALPKSFRYRIDSANATSSTLSQVADNIGRVQMTDIFNVDPHQIDSGGALSSEQERALARFSDALSGVSPTLMLPTTRLLIADVFPDETVEFPFSTLTSDDRSTMGKMCGFGEPGSQRSQAHVGEATPPARGFANPRILRDVPPQYTSDAMRQNIQGSVFVECVVQPDGTVGAVRVVQSLDTRFGLDAQALKAAKQWRFAPATNDGVPVSAKVVIELRFTLR